MNQALCRVSLLFLLAPLALNLSGTQTAQAIRYGSSSEEASPSPQPKAPPKYDVPPPPPLHPPQTGSNSSEFFLQCSLRHDKCTYGPYGVCGGNQIIDYKIRADLVHRTLTDLDNNRQWALQVINSVELKTFSVEPGGVRLNWKLIA
jgi:hypothetical protein